MRKAFLVLIMMFVLVLAGSCNRDLPLVPTDDTGESITALSINAESIAKELIVESGWAMEGQAVHVDGDLVTVVSSESIVGDVVHHRYEVRVGPGTYDVIGLHRVVREPRPNRSIRTKQSVFLQHGDAVGFEGAFLFGAEAPNVPDDQAIAVYLAQNDVDVWGIDQPWLMVPYGTADLSFMADWGMQNQVDNLRIALATARHTRAMTGSSNSKMHLLGYSSGAFTGYAYVNEETQLPHGQRHVAGYIPVEGFAKSDIQTVVDFRCVSADALEAQLNGGVYQNETGFLLATVGFLARTNPSGPSPIAPPLNNLQAALFVGSATYQLSPSTPWYHFVAGTFASGLPTGLQYLTNDAWIDFLLTASPYEPNRFLFDLSTLACDQVDSPFDDYLSEIAVPVLFVGAAGGYGNVGVFTTTLLASSDVTTHVVSFMPPQAIAIDYGHLDLFVAENAVSAAWSTVLDWVVDHSEPSDLARKEKQD